jgi:acetate kinase
VTRILVLNTGSSSVKWTVLAADKTALAGGSEPWAAEDSATRADQLKATLARAPAFDVAGHRIVHGGLRFRQAVFIDPGVREELAALSDLDPEHMHAALAGIDAVSAAFPTVPQVATFDTAFHATMPEAAAGYGLPFEWVERWGLRRFGFHGLSVAYAVERTNELLDCSPSRLIVCHLGSGCSVTAVEAGRSIDTTMGFSPLEGVMMATRSGTIDPGLMLYLQQHCQVSVEELRETLTKRSGLRGVSGISGDLREVLQSADGGSSRAQLAYGRFVISIRRALGSMMGALGGVDALVFTGGIGENSARVRRDATRALQFAGLELDEDANASADVDRDISVPGTRVRVLVLQAREDLAILTEVLCLRRTEHADGDGTDAGKRLPDQRVPHVAAAPDLPVASTPNVHRSSAPCPVRSPEQRSPAKKLIVFDLDGTLAASKAPLDAEMATLLDTLLKVVKVAVISGGGWPQFEAQLLSQLSHDERLRALSLLPTCGTQYRQYDGDWNLLYAENFSDQEREQVTQSLNAAITSSELGIETTWGEQIEDRGSQITFSALGQQAPIDEKEQWDPDFTKRKKLKAALEPRIPGFSVRLGGTTSVDVTKLGIDKGYGMRKLRDILGIGLQEMLFIGDALFPGGNDYPAKEAGVESIQVRDPNETKRVIEVLIACFGRAEVVVRPVADQG